MKKHLSLLFMAVMAIVSCQKFDDSEIWNKLNEHDTRIAYLEELCKAMNADIVNIQTLVTALESNDYIVNASPLVSGDGYTFIFKSGKSIVIYDGKDGQNGLNGADGVTPVISVKQDADGIYYWTVNGEWLIVDGKKVKASATDGLNGENGLNGIDGITPKFKIEDNYWYISYDNEKTWEKLGKATGSNGLDGVNGEDGDSLFKKVFVEDGYVCFEMDDENNTIIKLPLQKETTLEVTLNEAGKLRTVVSPEEARVTTKLKINGKINNADMTYIQHFTCLIELDLHEATFDEVVEGYPSVFYLNPYRDKLVNRTLYRVFLPNLNEGGAIYSHCSNLEYIIVPSQETYSWYFDSESDIDMSFCPMLHTLEYSEGVVEIPSDCRTYYANKGVSHYYNEDSKYSNIILPSTTETVSSTFMRYKLQNLSNTWVYEMSDCVVTCKAVTPPIVSSISGRTYNYINCTLYVPRESLNAYKEHSV